MSAPACAGRNVAHTPGPWTLASLPTKSGRNRRGLCGGGRRICDISIYDERDAANARLIAASPELLAALRMCLLNGNLDQQERDMGNAALSKAEGRP